MRLPLSLSLLAGCTTAVVPAGPSWKTSVEARIRDASRAFEPDGDAYTSTVVELRLRARFSSSGARIARDAAFAVRTSGFGRDEIEDLPDVSPSLGACSAATDPTGACVRRLEYERGEITEWWIAQEAGFEQGWTVDVPPDGRGPLALHVATSAGVRLHDGEIELESDGETLVVSAVDAWDADGRPLRAWLEPADGGFRVRADDAGARYPIEVDPLYSTAAWTVSGAPEIIYLGTAIAGAGDVDADGFADVIVGAPASSSLAGRAFVYHGSASGLSTVATSALKGGEDGDQFGAAVAGAGDVDGDGYDDVVVSAWLAGYYDGKAYVFHGSADGVSTTAATEITGGYSTSFGYDVAGAGDVDKDGYDDILVGAPDAGTSGAVYVYAGSSTGIGTTAAATLTGAGSKTNFGIAVSAAGDVDGDGYDDVIVGDNAYSSGTGRAYVFEGAASGLSTTAAATLNGSTGSYFGGAVSAAGDVNGDGYDDVLVGAYGYSSSTGRAYLYKGSASGLATSPATTLTGGATGNYFGQAVTSAGDVNGDGYDDVAVGAYEYSSTTGRVYVYKGASTGLSSTAATTLTGEATGDFFGYAVAGAGDVDADGYDDLAIGALGHGSDGEGRAYLYEGSSSGTPTTAATTLDGRAAGESLGCAVANAGDVNGDGWDDVIVGAYRYESAGRAYLFAGSASGLATEATTTLEGPDASWFGYAVAGAGDVDADGYDDVIVGAPYYSAWTGRAYVFRGSASGLATTASTTISGSSSYQLGYSVSGAGDTDGDGYADVLVGAPGYSTYTGRVYLYAGSASGISSTATTTLTGAATGNYFGSSVSGGGDVNGDGYADLVVGAYGYSSEVGRAYVFSGSSAGVPTLASATLTSGSTSATQFGDAVAIAGDVDGDGYDDVVVGAPRYVNYTGRAHVFLGSSGGVATAAAVTLTGSAYYDYFGTTVAAAGDVDADGYADVIVGSPGYSSTGRADLYEGSSGGTATTAATSLFGTDGDALGSSLAAADLDGDGYDDVIVGSPGADDDAGKIQAWGGYIDADADGYAAVDDCDDTDPTAHPGGREAAADGVDGDCDGVDLCYRDDDGDDFGTSEVITGTSVDCAAGTGAPVATDCDDTTAAVSPGATEIVADGADQDCDGVDACYADADADGFGTAEIVAGSSLDCVSGTGAAVSGDCDDADAAISPDGAEIPGDAVDQDCDGAELCWSDADDDGFRTGGTVSSADADCDDPGEAGTADPSGDCDDTTGAVTPGNAESCDDRDEDCDGEVDEDPVDPATWYADADGDGYTDPAVSVVGCDPPAGYAAERGVDCDDADAARNPGATDVPDDGVDQDCDGADATAPEETDTSAPDSDDTDTVEKPPCGCASAGSGGVSALLAAAMVRRRRATRA